MVLHITLEAQVLVQMYVLDPLVGVPLVVGVLVLQVSLQGHLQLHQDVALVVLVVQA